MGVCVSRGKREHVGSHGAKVYAMRHAPTSSNADKRWMGRLDLPCQPFEIPTPTMQGIEALMRNGLVVKTSPLARAVSTARALGLPYEVDERLTERDLGEWSGKTHAATRRSDKAAWLPGGKLDPTYTPPMGEPWEEFLGRVSSALVDYSSAATTALAITHNGVIRAMRIATGRIDVQDFLSAFEPPLDLSCVV
jgi:probable phosphoglycerate mutase